MMTREPSGKSLAIQEVRKKKRTQSFKRIYEKGIQLKSKVKNHAHLLQLNEQAEYEAMKPDQSANRYFASLKLAKELYCCYIKATA